jgi:hypothetical protein
LASIPQANKPLFAILNSTVFNIWTRAVSGRLESRIRISAEITYNNFPLRQLTEDEKNSLAQTGQAILDAREKFPTSTLADLYGSTSMPLDLIKAHEVNDRAVMKIFGIKSDAGDEQILSKLFSEYDEMTRGLVESAPVKKTRK